jgi:hypothetical protein
MLDARLRHGKALLACLAWPPGSTMLIARLVNLPGLPFRDEAIIKGRNCQHA